MSATTTTETDDDLAELQERLEAIEYDTLGGGRCLATVTDIREKRRDRIEVVAELPSGREYSERFDVPEVAGEQSRLVRFLDARGYGLSTIDHLIGSDVEVEVEVDDDGPEFVVPEPSRSYSERIGDYVPDKSIIGAWFVAALLTWPITGIIFALNGDPSEDNMDEIELFLIYILFFGIWSLFAMLTHAAVTSVGLF